LTASSAFVGIGCRPVFNNSGAGGKGDHNAPAMGMPPL